VEVVRPPGPGAARRDPQRVGVLMGLGAYGLWGVFPLYFTALDPAGPVEILLHRVVWTLVVCAVLLTLTRSWAGALGVVRSGRALAMLAAAAVLIATNWLVYIYGVLSEQVVQTALGYYINPLVTVLLGVLVLRERLRPAQWVAVGVGAVAVAVMAAAYGGVPWIALTLAASFGLYGLLKNRVGRSVGAVHSLSVETAVLAPVALAGVAWLQVDGSATFADLGLGHALLLASTGVATAVPLLMFAGAAGRVPLSTIGLLQYLTPTLQLLIGVAVLGEPMPPARWVGFGLVWLALAVLTVDMLRAGRRRVTQTSPAGHAVVDC
jgi:chloramphenicol-sensitive protein RarD